MKILNVWDCGGGTGGNTGIPDCDLLLENATATIFVPPTWSANQAEMETLDTVLADLQQENSPAKRAYPVKEFTGTEDQSSEKVTTDTPYGNTYKVRDGKPVYSYRLDRGMESWANLRKFDNKHKNYRVLLVFEQNNGVLGYTNKDNELEGLRLDQLGVDKFNMNGGDDVFHFMLTLGFASLAQFERFGFVRFKEDIEVMELLKGLVNVEVEETVALTVGGVTTLKAYAPGGQDLYPIYSAELQQTTAWQAKNADTGGIIPITGVALASAGDAWEVTLDTSDSNYTALASGDKIDINLAGPATLAAAPINTPGIEGLGTQIVKA
jgi:hypothetical protein